MSLSFEAAPSGPRAPRAARLSLLAAAVAGLLVTGCERTAPAGAIGRGEVEHALAVLAGARAHGFPPGAFGEQQLAEMSKSKDPKVLAQRDKQLRAALVAYARAQHGLGISGKAMPADWGLHPAAYDAEAALTTAVRERKFADWLDNQAPATPEYKFLQQAYVSYLKTADAGGWAPLTIKAAPQALVARLAVEDPALAQTPAGGTVDVSGALSRFQAAHGLPTSGRLDAETVKELNVPAIARAAQIRANLERLRWLPRETPTTRIDVNTAAAIMDYVEDGQIKIRMLAASGKPGDETPMLTSKVDSIVLNPPWNVPDGIAQEELYPKEAANPGYFAEHGYAVEDGRLVQKPSAESALGLVKFNFKNPYSVYLHDTPSKAAFSRTSRAVSHGCVRLANAVEFARMLLSKQPGWSAGRFDQTLASGETTTVALESPVPVRLVYLTAYPENGRVAFRPDVYGWDAELLRLLDARLGRTQAAAPAASHNKLG